MNWGARQAAACAQLLHVPCSACVTARCPCSARSSSLSSKVHGASRCAMLCSMQAGLLLAGSVAYLAYLRLVVPYSRGEEMLLEYWSAALDCSCFALVLVSACLCGWGGRGGVGVGVQTGTVVALNGSFICGLLAVSTAVLISALAPLRPRCVALRLLRPPASHPTGAEPLLLAHGLDGVQHAGTAVLRALLLPAQPGGHHPGGLARGGVPMGLLPVPGSGPARQELT